MSRASTDFLTTARHAASETTTPPLPRPDTAIICLGEREAVHFRREIASRDRDNKLIYPKSWGVTNPDFMVIYAFQAVHGYRWKNVLLPRSTRFHAYEHGRLGRFEEWLRECVQCRLMPGGQIIELP